MNTKINNNLNITEGTSRLPNLQYSSPSVVSEKDEYKMKKRHLQIDNPNTSSSNFYGTNESVCGTGTVLSISKDDFLKTSEDRRCKKCSHLLRISMKGGK